RDRNVTGVQTCALPILAPHRLQPPRLTHPTAAATWLLVAASQRLNRQVNATKHVNVLFNLLAECGQVVTRDNRVDTRQQALFCAVIAQRKFTAAGKAQSG